MFGRKRYQGVDVLREIALFRGCTRRQLEAVSGLVCILDVEPGTVLSREGRPADQFILITSGSARATTAAGDSDLLGRGDFVGETSLEPGARATVTAVVATPMTLLASTPAELRHLVEVAPIVGRRLRRSLPGPDGLHLRAAGVKRRGRRAADGTQPVARSITDVDTGIR
jgi:CRP-like cAMP-binding protein